jgi:Predicted membrane protein
MKIVIMWFLWLIIYSFLGWLYESIVCSFEEGKLINRGFLNGPLCPIYGFGATTSILFFYGRTNNVFLLFICGASLACTLEYITSILMEKIFHARWWDYSNRRFNFHGRICLLGAVVFGVLVVLLITILHPFIYSLIKRLDNNTLFIISSILFILLIIDLFITIHHLFSLNNRLKEIQSAIDKYHALRIKRMKEIKTLAIDKFEESEFYNKRIKALIHKDKFINMRIITAFPRLNRIKNAEAWQKIKAHISKK